MHGQEFVKEILDSFLQESTDLLKQLPDAMKRQDTNSAKGLAHQLKGLSAVCTAQGLQDLSLRMETALRDGDWATAEAVYQEMSAEHTKIVDFIHSNLNN